MKDVENLRDADVTATIGFSSKTGYRERLKKSDMQLP